MGDFFKTLPDKNLTILDLGSRIVDDQQHLGSYKQFCVNSKWVYTGADVESGWNVDIVLRDGYLFPFANESFDVIISGQTIEHIEYPWVWFKEMARVLRGTCCIIAPARIKEHKFPIDTFRYYPDGMVALAKWAGLTVEMVSLSNANKDMDDTVLIAKK